MNVRFGSLADKSSPAQIQLCPLLSKSGQTRVLSDCPLSAKSRHSGLRWADIRRFIDLQSCPRGLAVPEQAVAVVSSEPGQVSERVFSTLRF